MTHNLQDDYNASVHDATLDTGGYGSEPGEYILTYEDAWGKEKRMKFPSLEEALGEAFHFWIETEDVPTEISVITGDVQRVLLEGEWLVAELTHKLEELED